ncbi:hypothetical protein FGO68_gene10509 [Halteria grandinella]|uniref:Uncharacterized protein n=1 Tax=Halteria grandinella TaxID=5974 RepID=A0A8J8NQ08_HALGN|nr:hypothetical protein FGO68_gene10509 [Halteria grandinella]
MRVVGLALFLRSFTGCISCGIGVFSRGLMFSFSSMRNLWRPETSCLETVACDQRGMLQMMDCQRSVSGVDAIALFFKMSENFKFK